LLLVDVDGVISLFGFDHASPPAGVRTLIDGLPHHLSLDAARHLRNLAAVYEPVWCTGWEDRAGEHLPHLLDLPRTWPYVPLRAAVGAQALVRPGTSVAGHWKLAAIDAFAGPDRALAWVDDDLSNACDDWAAARPGPTLLVRTDPAAGLTEAEAGVLHGWASG
jgi:hypothetical protein